MLCFKRALILAAGLPSEILNRAEPLQDINYEDGVKRFIEDSEYMEVNLESINDGMQYLARVSIGT